MDQERAARDAEEFFFFFLHVGVCFRRSFGGSYRCVVVEARRGWVCVDRCGWDLCVGVCREMRGGGGSRGRERDYAYG